MKKLIVVAAILTSNALLAKSEVRDLMYFPEKGTLNGQTSIDVTDSEFELVDEKTETKTFEITQQLSYVVSKGLSLGVQLQKEESETEQNGDEFEREGYENPTFVLQKRINWQDEDGSNLDIGLQFSPDMNDREDSSETKKGNVAAGGPSTGFYIKYGKKVEDTEFSLSASAFFFGKATEEDATGSGESESEATQSLQLEYTWQRNLNDKFSFNFGGIYVYYGDSESQDSSGSKTEIEGYGLIGLFGTLKANVTQDFVVSVSYGSTLDADTDAKVGGTEYELENLSQSSLSLAATYEF